MSKIKPHGTRTRVQTDNPEPKSRVIQSEAKNCDINTIVARAKQTGTLPVLMGREPIAELPTAATYLDMMNQVVQARQQFERLPAAIRNQFDNKPENLLATLEASQKDTKIADNLREIGILNPKEETPPPEAKPQIKTQTAEAAAAANEPPPPPSK